MKEIKQFSPPIAVPFELVRGLYRFSERLDQVNWTARRVQDTQNAEYLVPHICKFLDQNIRRVNYDSNNLRAIIGVSGIDSAVSAWLAAETMQRAKKQQTAQETDLFMVNFRAMNLEDEQYGRYCYQALRNAYRDLNIHFHWADMTNVIKGVDEITEGILETTKHPKSWPAEPTTGLIDVTTVSMGYKVWAAALDSTNKTEEVLGEINIPSGCSIKILANLWKSQVYDLGEILGIPKTILNRKPINSTYGTSKIDSYFGEIPSGFTPRETYQVLDLVLEQLYQDGKSVDEVSQGLGHSKEFIQRVKTKIDSQNHRRKIPTFQPL